MRFKACAITHPGRLRGNNEDAVGWASENGGVVLPQGRASEKPNLKGPVVFIVSDGLGGENAGEVASRMVVKRVLQAFADDPGVLCGLSEAEGKAWLEGLLWTANADILSHGREHPSCAGMGATATLLWTDGKQGFFAHVGDSRLYLWREESLIQLSEDDTLAYRDYQKGLIGEERMSRHPERHVLDQVLGTRETETPVVQVGKLGVQAKDCFILCSDGLSDGLDKTAMMRLLGAAKEPADKAADLLENSLEASGKDNTSLIVVEVRPGWWTA